MSGYTQRENITVVFFLLNVTCNFVHRLLRLITVYLAALIGIESNRKEMSKPVLSYITYFFRNLSFGPLVFKNRTTFSIVNISIGDILR